ncbi:ABC transporter ATP-binding protein [Streptomyces sp. NRRL B-24720]|uniref:ABC transporter ATP-binding protein n=1 Tax=Streptomyces sp. NRRL B-24720 TaxID=1476876 RepID=UPI000B15BC9D|nr:ABC transporter ATP-binding protein [Streptomyces sp. NRRL B-24720]
MTSHNTARRVASLFKPHRAQITLIGMVVLVESSVSIAWPFLLRETLDVAIPQREMGLLTLLAAGMVAAAVTANALGVYQALLSNRAGQQVMHDLRTAAYARVQLMSLRFFTGARSGDVQSRLINDVSGMQTTLTSTWTSLVSNATSVLAALAAMLVLDWRMTLFVLPFLYVFVWISRRVGKERRVLTTDRQQQMSTMTGIIGESLSIGGVLLGRTMGRNRALLKAFHQVSRSLADIDVRTKMSGAWRMSAIGILLASTPPLLYWVAGAMAYINGASPSVGTLVAFVTLQQALIWPTNELLSAGVQVQSSLALFQRIFEYLDLKSDIVEPQEPLSLAASHGEVRFESVAFSYDDAHGNSCLTDVDLVVTPGSHVAIVGPTGSGKTTLGYLTARVYDVDDGRITIDGVDVRDLSFESLADSIGVVSQDPFFYNDSIANNLRFAKPDASEDEIHDAARAAHIHNFILGLPEQYDTVLGERGYRLSGGEKQRLALARTILRNPPIMILDEATSALDVITESAVQQSLERLPIKCTRISIAHRLSTARDADQIVVLDHGKIVEKGRHDALMAANGRYAELVRQSVDHIPEGVSP